MIDKEGNAKIMDFGIARSLTGVGTTAEEPDLKPQAERGSRRIFSRGLGGDQDFLIDDPRRKPDQSSS
jgi:hypothetical protein